MKNSLEKVDVKNTDIPFKIPYSIYILQYFLNLLFTSIFLLFPLIIIAVIVIITPAELKQLIAMIGLTLSLLVYMIIYSSLEANFEPKFKFYKKFKSKYLKGHIIHKIKCPKCQNINYSCKPKIPNAQYYYNYSYLCNSCNTGFEIYKISEKGIRPILVFRELDKKEKN